VDLLHK